MIKIVEEILDTKLKRFKYNCPSDITDLVFLEIEKSYLTMYEARVKSKGKTYINRLIGAKVKDYWRLDNVSVCMYPKSKLIGRYLEHSNIPGGYYYKAK